MSDEMLDVFRKNIGVARKKDLLSRQRFVEELDWTTHRFPFVISVVLRSSEE